MSPSRRRLSALGLLLCVSLVVVAGLAVGTRDASDAESNGRAVAHQVNAAPGGFLERGIAHDRGGGRNCDPSLVRQALQRCRVGEPQRFEKLTVAPILSASSDKTTPFLTLAKALETRVVTAKEMDSAEVPTVAVTLTQDVPVLIQSGDIITGGKQDRYFKRDMLLVEKGETKNAPVYCVEPGRWSGGVVFGERVTAANNLTQSGLGATLREADSGDTNGQADVWRRVQSNLKGVTAQSARTTFAEVETSDSVTTARERFSAYFGDFAASHPDAIGVLLAAGDQILGAEVFTDHKRFVAQWPSILNAAVVDALQVSGATDPISREDFVFFLEAAADSNVRQHEPIAAGEEYSISTSEAFGTLLFHGRHLLHARLFPQQAIQLAHEPTARGEARTQQTMQNY